MYHYLLNEKRSLFEGNKDHLFSQARSEFMRQEHQVGSLKSCINELQQHVYVQGLELQDVHHGYVEYRREQIRHQEQLSMKEKVLRSTRIRNVHELGDEESSRESYELMNSQCQN